MSDCSPARLFCPWDFPGKNTGVGCHFLLQGIFSTQGSNQDSRIAGGCLPSEPPRKPMNAGVGSLSFFQGIFLIWESNQGLLHCTWVLYQLSCQGSPTFFNITHTKLWFPLIHWLNLLNAHFVQDANACLNPSNLKRIFFLINLTLGCVGCCTQAFSR